MSSLTPRSRVLLLCTAAIGTACASVDRVTTNTAGPLVIKSERDTTAAADTVIVGGKASLRVVGADAATTVTWAVSDTSVVRILQRFSYRVELGAVRAGTATVTANQAGRAATFGILVRDSAGSPPPPPPGYEVIDLAPGAESAQPNAINDDGTIVGVRADSGSPAYDFVYKNGVIRPLAGVTNVPRAECCTPGPTAISATEKIAGGGGIFVALWDSPDATPRLFDAGPYNDDTGLYVVGVNDRGDILASLAEHDGLHGHGTALLWRNGVRQNLGYLADTGVGHPSTYPRAWNSNGQIVGSSKVGLIVFTDHPPGEIFHPIIWEGGVMRDLGTLAPRPCPPHEQNVPDVRDVTDCSFGEATSINSQGVVVGTSSAGSGGRAFVWEKGVMRDLGAYPGHNTRAVAINDRGQILGSVDEKTFLWDKGQTQIVTDTFTAMTTALGANGEVIGSTDAGGNVRHAFVWKDGHFTELGTGEPIAINSRGDIIGVRLGPYGYQATLWRKKPGT